MSARRTQQLLDSAYIVATVLFILSIKWLSSPAIGEARRVGGRNCGGAGRGRDALQSRSRRNTSGSSSR